MKLPQALLDSLSDVPGFEREAFVAVHENGSEVTSIRINPNKFVEGDLSFTVGDKVPWAENGFYLSSRPSFTFDPLFHAGCYYVQEASSMFLEQALKQLLDLSQPLNVLDLCAAPGGKSTHIQSLLSSESLLVSNEVIKPRSIVLTDNIIKWGCKNVFVTNNDPKAFQKLPAYFDAMVVDAPCSGSGLFRKDEDAITEWSPANVQLCSQRQQRILADALPALKEGGLLVYSTCSYSEEEDEAIADWLVNEMNMESVPLQTESFAGITETLSPQKGATGYRFYPYKIKGEGFFLACFLKKDEQNSAKQRQAKPEEVSTKEKRILADWVNEEGLRFLRFRNSVFAIPENLLQPFAVIEPLLNLQYAGVQTGEIMKEKLVPHHALAQSTITQPSLPFVELPYNEAIRYLQRQDFAVEPECLGWNVVRYKGHNLGWINALKNRVNNYYPKEIRILKQHNNTAFKK